MSDKQDPKTTQKKPGAEVHDLQPAKDAKGGGKGKSTGGHTHHQGGGKLKDGDAFGQSSHILN